MNCEICNNQLRDGDLTIGLVRDGKITPIHYRCLGVIQSRPKPTPIATVAPEPEPGPEPVPEPEPEPEPPVPAVGRGF